MNVKLDPKTVELARSGFSVQSWDIRDSEQNDIRIAEISAMIEGGFQIVSCTTVVFGQSVVQTVILVKYPK